MMMMMMIIHLCTEIQARRLSVWTIWRTSGPTISRPGDLDLSPLTLKLVRITERWLGNLPANFGVSRSFLSRLIGQQCQTHYVTFRLWTGDGAWLWSSSSSSVCVPTLKFVDLPFGRYCACTVWAIIDLMTLTFDLLTSKSVHGLLVRCTSILSILDSLFPFSS